MKLSIILKLRCKITQKKRLICLSAKEFVFFTSKLKSVKMPFLSKKNEKKYSLRLKISIFAIQINEKKTLGKWKKLNL